MKIGIDISQIVYGTGVSRYTANLVKNLLSIDKENTYVLFGGSGRRMGDLIRFTKSLKGDVESRIFPIAPTLADILWNRLHILKVENFVGKVDVFHSSDWSQPPSDAFKVTTIHDLVPLKFPRISSPKIISVHRRRLKHIKGEVDRVIVPSMATKKDLLTSGFNRGKIRVIPEAVAPEFKPAKKSEIERLKKKYKISGKYVLAVGTNPRKNIERIIKAFDLVRPGEDLKLVSVGTSPTMRLKERRNIRLIGHVPDRQMPVFYSGAEVLLYPSLYEGFGLPILEAFACKTPVVTSNFGSLKEVSGDAAMLVDPYDVASIVEGIKKALRGRKELVKKGLARLRQFSWEKTARETLEVYQEAES